MILVIGIILYIIYADYVRKRPVERAGQLPSPLLAPNQLDKNRLYMVGGFIAALYAISFTWLNYGWYRNYKQSPFHWFDDRKEWVQMDKVSHVYAGYFETVWAYELLRWTGMDNKRAAITSAFIGMGYSSSVEIWDGISAKWGASWSDLVANGIGVLLAMVQYLMWEEQRIMCKYSYKPGTYPAGELSERADDLFGKTFIEKTLKDYHNITIWLSVNPSKFIPGIKPDWFCFSIGYGAENLYGGFENKWTDPEGKLHDRTDIPRTRVIKLSLDADLPRLRKNDPAGKAAFKALNIFKVPFPSYDIKLPEKKQ